MFYGVDGVDSHRESITSGSADLAADGKESSEEAAEDPEDDIPREWTSSRGGGSRSMCSVDVLAVVPGT